MSYKLTFSPSEEHLKRIREKGGYPFACGVHTFQAGDSVVVESLLPFIHNQKMNGIKPPPTNEEIIKLGLVDARLTVEIVNEEESNGEHTEG